MNVIKIDDSTFTVTSTKVESVTYTSSQLIELRTNLLVKLTKLDENYLAEKTRLNNRLTEVNSLINQAAEAGVTISGS